MRAVPLRVLKTQSIRPRRTDLFLLGCLVPPRPLLGWGTKSGLKRSFKEYKFERVREILNTGDFRSLCAAIGFFDVNWALFEQSLDRAVEVIYQSLEGSEIERVLPRPYARKSQFLRDAVERIDLLKPLGDEAIELLDRADKLAITRNDLIHGVVTQIESRDGRYKFLKIDYGRYEHTYREFIFDSLVYPKLVNEVQALGGDMSRLGMKINQIEERVLRP